MAKLVKEIPEFLAKITAGMSESEDSPDTRDEGCAKTDGKCSNDAHDGYCGSGGDNGCSGSC